MKVVYERPVSLKDAKQYTALVVIMVLSIEWLLR